MDDKEIIGRGASSVRMSARPLCVPRKKSRATCSSPRTIALLPGRYDLAMRIARFSHNGEVSYGLVLGPDGRDRPAGEAAGAGANGAGAANGSATAGANGGSGGTEATGGASGPA